jgi:hypothetical protein
MNERGSRKRRSVPHIGREVVILVDYGNGYKTTWRGRIDEGGNYVLDAVQVYEAILTAISGDLADPDWNRPEWNMADAMDHIDRVVLVDLDRGEAHKFDHVPRYFCFSGDKAYG